MKKLIFFLIPALIVAISCTKEDVFNTYDIAFGETISHNKNVEVTFQDIQDSRCPTDVVCVWEGQAEVSLSAFFDSDDAPTIISLIERAGHSELAETSVNGYHFKLLEVNPYPNSANNIPQKEDYTIRLLIEAE